MNAKVVVELGTGAGHSTGAFLRGLKKTGGILYSIDNGRNKWVARTREMFRKNENNVFFIQSDSRELIQGLDKVDILLCDSYHAYEHVVEELKTWSTLHPRIIFIHDTLHEGKETAPCQAAREHARKHGFLFINHQFMHGLGIIYRGEN